MGRGHPIDRSAWPVSGPFRAWLEFLDGVHRANGLRSQRTIARDMGLAAPTRAGQLLRGLAWPADTDQARRLIIALGGLDGEVTRGLRLHRDACGAREAELRPDQEPSWWSRSGYVDQVRDIAPRRLVGREPELAELASFCAGDEGYGWWQAEARAGKSALMSWFVLHPPAGAWVVSFFVTARLAGQSDSVAFTDGLCEQLAAIVGERLPEIASVAGRDRLRRQLLSAAAARARRAGQRLVLVVDGLDEDCGVRPGSGLASIASLLPKRPDESLRVIVAGRPDPPLPGDVDEDHPLRAARVRALAASPYARQVAELARRELDDVLAGGPGGSGALGRDVLGLVTAAGGGLTRDDLETLTGRPRFELEGLLHGVVGRTLANRPDPDATGRQQVFLFTHETLRDDAASRLGPQTLDRFRDQIHAWADDYRRRRWPAATPGYLLRAYPRMLRDAGDVERLVRLAGDPVRHDRMLQMIGGDSGAMSEVIAAQELLAAQDRPDVGTALHLAMHRSALHERNANIPVELPAAWARLGQVFRASALAYGISDPARRAVALARLAVAVAATGDRGQAQLLCGAAESVARSIGHQWQQLRILPALAAATAAAEGLAAAERMARDITERAARTRMLAALVEPAASSGDLDRAEALAWEVVLEVPRSRALAAVAEAALARGDASRARALADALAPPELRLRVLAGLAGVTAGAHAGVSADEIRSAAERTLDPYHRARVLAVLGESTRSATVLQAAMSAARDVAEPRLRAEAAAAVAAAAFRARRPDLGVVAADVAEDVAFQIADTYRQAEALVVVAGASAGPDREARAVRLLEAAEAGARRAGDGAWRASLGTTAALLAPGGGARVLALTDAMESPAARASVLVQIVVAASGRGDSACFETFAAAADEAVALAPGNGRLGRDLAVAGTRMGRRHHAEALLDTSHDQPQDRLGLLTDLSRAAKDGGDRELAKTLARAAADEARRQGAEPDGAVLRQVVLALAQAAEYDDALTLAGALVEPSDRAEVLGEALKHADPAGCLLLAPAAFAVTEQLRGYYNYLKHGTVRSAVDALVRTGSIGEARRLVAGLTDREVRAGARIDLAEHAVNLGLMDEAATAVAAAVLDVDGAPVPVISPPHVELAVVMATIGGTRSAEGIIDRIPGPDDRVRAWSGIARTRAGANGQADARAAVRRALTIARGVERPWQRDRLLADLVAVMADCVDVGQADALARTIEDQEQRGRAFVALAERAAAARPAADDGSRHASRALAEALLIGRWASLLETTARVDPAALAVAGDNLTEWARVRPPAAADHTGSRVFVVEPEPLICLDFREILAETGFEATGFEDRRAALDAAAGERPDLVVLDISLFARDGWYTLHRLRCMTDAPILLTSTQSQLEYVVRALRLGADDYLVKPIDAAVLRSAVERLLHARDTPPIWAPRAA
ncbi:response regulator [Dactylosporangium sp. NPDC049742]|uniref:response regulator n=1 Tax=Dactylosporangium sp. NPDC049742 TaxID=3154737 RepID=UPI0034421C35